jgi:lysophospholipid hydrolase
MHCPVLILLLCAGTGILISTEVVRTALGSSALEPGNDFKLTAWLGGQEDQHKVVVYQGGHSN